MRVLFLLLLFGVVSAAPGCKCESSPPPAKESVEDKEIGDELEAEADEEVEEEDNENE